MFHSMKWPQLRWTADVMFLEGTKLIRRLYLASLDVLYLEGSDVSLCKNENGICNQAELQTVANKRGWKRM